MIKNREDQKAFPVFYYSIWFSTLNNRLFNPLNYLFYLIKFFPQFLHFVIVGDDDQASLRDLHGHAAPGVKSRFCLVVALKVLVGDL